uniref:Polyamine-modulated factor 1-binding protein 1 n=1 Tax=Sphenodon punctatus TaxID=8508 RepID=A0A8D0GJL8_SPHPU
DTLQNKINLLRQKCVASSNEVEALRASLGAARSDSCRLHQESELVVTNVNQWVREQRQANEKLGQKIREQIKHIAQLTGEKDYLQGAVRQLQQENKHLKKEADKQRIEWERLKVLQGSDWVTQTLLSPPRPELREEE